MELFELPGAAALPDERRHPATDLRTHGVKHVAYEVDDIEAFTERLRALGADIVWDLRVHDDVKVCFCATTPAIWSSSSNPSSPLTAKGPEA